MGGGNWGRLLSTEDPLGLFVPHHPAGASGYQLRTGPHPPLLGVLFQREENNTFGTSYDAYYSTTDDVIVILTVKKQSCQCWISPRFNPSILHKGGFLGAPDEAMTNEMTKKRQVSVNTVEDDSVYVLYINAQKCRENENPFVFSEIAIFLRKLLKIILFARSFAKITLLFLFCKYYREK